MTGTFVGNIERLLEKTPRHLTGSVVVDQVYAHYQHEGITFHHPDGGEALYLKTPLYVKHGVYFARLGKAAVHGELVQAMKENVEDLSLEVYHRAPWEFGDLRGSGHPRVIADGHTVYDRPPMVKRLSELDLKAKEHLRYLFDPHRYDRPGGHL